MLNKPMLRVANRIKAPVDAFLHTESASSILLLIAAAVALLWANSSAAESYEHLWHTEFSITLGSWSMKQSLHFWINDFLMTIFFLVVGLEIKREIVEGELADMRRASLPIAAAVGGMLVPAAIYFALNPTGPGSQGWGVPMATDIAFALGVLGLLGKRVPASLRVLLLALAIIDDIGAILVIAVFYSSGINPDAFITIAIGLAILLGMLQAGVRPGSMYIVPVIVLWAGAYSLGVHPTIAGVIVGLVMPVRPWLSRKEFVEVAEVALREYHVLTSQEHKHKDALTPLRRLSMAGREAASPVSRAEAAFHPWVAFLIMPLFALAYAGVNLGGVEMSLDGASMATLGVMLGLAFGKPAGILLFSWLTTRMGWCTLPRGVTWGGITVLGCAAGIGFTMAIFIAELAFRGSDLLQITKLAILGGSAIAGVTAMTMGRIFLAGELDPAVARLTPAQVEVSNEA
ncbi:MAG: Na+/H+ antiporter NhaA [Proteobacteria bacterium]|nr:Na+/H+ antiporter NhaA [Pseudomonadota bacterium]